VGVSRECEYVQMRRERNNMFVLSTSFKFGRLSSIPLNGQKIFILKYVQMVKKLDLLTYATGLQMNLN